jgi:DegV family protein with EDD domain
MDYKIVADSSCDVTDELKKLWKIVTIPFSLLLDEKEYIDDENLDQKMFMAEMAACTGKIASAAPSPLLFQKAFEGAHTSFAVTLSSKLSGVYDSAMVGKQLAEESGAGADVHVFDTLSAVSGEVLVAHKIYQLVQAGLEKTKIVETVEKFIKEMKTYFVLENINNLLKNGRLGKITGKIITTLGIKPIMRADNGNIALCSHGRGSKQILRKMVDLIEQSKKNTEGTAIVIAHCNNPSFAETLAEAVKNRYKFEEILVMPMHGLSSVYADDQGVVMSF